MFNFLKNIGPIELGAIGLILVALFGAKVITNLGRTSGETFREIKKIKKTFTEAIEDDNNKQPKSNKKQSK